MSAFQRFPSRDFGLLILRGAGFLLAATFGLQKIGWYWTAFHAGKSLSAIGLPPLIARMGFPIPVVLALWITFNESIGALLIGCGFLTKILAASAALGMAGALYTSVRLNEDWLRAALYLIAFVALALIGPGRFSVDHLIKSKTAAPAPPH
jgi:putative oxidoreductase